MRRLKAISWAITVGAFVLHAAGEELTYPIVDTGQQRCYNDRHEIAYPRASQSFFGQDAQYVGNTPKYRSNGDGTVTDLVTGLMWQRKPGRKMTYAQAVAGAARCRVGGYTDWRLPTIKELYSLILFSGTDPDPRSTNTSAQRPFIDTKYFKFQYGKPSEGERIIDSQWATSTRYGSTTMHGNATMFGVNFADGRIKGYPVKDVRRRTAKRFYVIYVRGNSDYGKNEFVDNGDGTITDNATGLTWMQVDSGHLKAGRKRNGKLNWKEALAWAEQLEYAGYSDWRLPNVKELQSIVDYARSPDTTNSPAIDPVFKTTRITIEEGRKDYPFFWSSTTHCSLYSGGQGAYIAFGESPGYMRDPRTGRSELLDVHGAGSQRSDPKSGNPERSSKGRGPQGDVVRIYNFVRCVRGGTAAPKSTGPRVKMTRERPRRESQEGGEGQRGGGGAGFVQRLDRNGDGKVSRSEFDGPKKHFSKFDRNSDGYITEDEAPTSPPPLRRKR